jgi:hypothetical protein
MLPTNGKPGRRHRPFIKPAVRILPDEDRPVAWCFHARCLDVGCACGAAGSGRVTGPPR